MVASADVIPPEALMMIVHGEQDMHFHQPLVPGTQLTTTSEAYAVRVGGSGTRFVVKVDSVDGEGRPVLTQYVTVFIRGMSDGESGGPDKPAHDFPEDVRDNKVAIVLRPRGRRPDVSLSRRVGRRDADPPR